MRGVFYCTVVELCEADPLGTCTIITTSANGMMRPLHDRMPVILPAEHWPEWLDPTFRDREALEHLLQPAADDLLTAVPVGQIVNNARNEVPECVEPLVSGD